MRLNHLSDSEMQSYLDRNDAVRSNHRHTIDEHLRFCNQCSDSIDQYDQLYSRLKVSEPGEFSDNVVNSIMYNLPTLPGKEMWRVVLPWLTRFASFMLFVVMIIIPYDIKVPSISLPSLSWPTISWPVLAMPDVVTRMIEITGSAFSMENLSLYLVVLLFGVIFYNLERIIFGGVQRSRI